jgi:hypothetical protein
MRMLIPILSLMSNFLYPAPEIPLESRQRVRNDTLTVSKCNDFSIDGKGDNSEWKKAQWTNLSKLDTGGRSYESKFKILYSQIGLYLLFVVKMIK